MTCPTCRAAWRETSECPRCGSDLAPLMRVSAAAWRHRRTAAAALAAGQWSDALHHAQEAKQLQRTEAGDDLVLLAGLLAR
jgi:predicted amidophosphoribosyltransferase